MPADQYYVDADAARDALRRRSIFNVIDLASGWKVALILRKDRTFSRDEFARRMKMTILGVPVFVASPEDTIVAKLEWSKLAGGSQRQRRDVAGIVATVGAALDRAYVERRVRDLDVADQWEAATTLARSSFRIPSAWTPPSTAAREGAWRGARWRAAWSG
jgi:hypothetical protein